MLNDLVVRLLADSSQAKKELNSFASFAKKAFTAVIAAASVKESLDQADEQIITEKKLAAVIKATGGAAGVTAEQIRDMAKARADVTNFTDEMTENFAALMATFTQVKGEVFLETIKIGQDMSAVMGQDLKASAIQLGKALNDPIKGVSALAEVGVSFNEEQKKTIKLLQESGDMAGAQKVILAELKNEFGGAAEEMVSPWQQLKNSFGEIAESLGKLVMPAVWLVEKAVTALADGVNFVVDGFYELIGLSDEIHGNDGSFGRAFTQHAANALAPLFPEVEKEIPNVEKVTEAIDKLNREIEIAQGYDPLNHIVEDFKALNAPGSQIWDFIHKYRELEKVKLNASIDEAIRTAQQELKVLKGELTSVDVELAKFAGADPAKLAQLRELLELQNESSMSEDIGQTLSGTDFRSLEGVNRVISLTQGKTAEDSQRKIATNTDATVAELKVANANLMKMNDKLKFKTVKVS